MIFTYDVEWEMSSVKWASRWDVYLYATDEQIHWFSIINSLMIVLFLTGESEASAQAQAPAPAQAQGRCRSCGLSEHDSCPCCCSLAGLSSPRGNAKLDP